MNCLSKNCKDNNCSDCFGQDDDCSYFSDQCFQCQSVCKTHNRQDLFERFLKGADLRIVVREGKDKTVEILDFKEMLKSDIIWIVTDKEPVKIKGYLFDQQLTRLAKNYTMTMKIK